jgi:CBS domain-containing protein
MKIGEICNRDVQVVKADTPLADAAREMMRHDIGALIVIESRGLSSAPIGMLTDRDILCGQLSRRADIYCLNVGDVMTANPLSLEEDVEVDEAIRRLSARGVRRAPVVNRSGDLMGVISFDDLFPVVARNLESVAQLIELHSQRPVAAGAPAR